MHEGIQDISSHVIMIDINITVHIAQLNAKIVRIEVNKLKAYLTIDKPNAVNL